MAFPELASARLRLTQITSTDIDDVFELFSSTDVTRFYDLDAFNNPSQARDLINLFQSRYEAKQGIRWALRLKDSEKLIGTCGFNTWSEKMRNATVGYDLLPVYWSRGITTEALREILRAVFKGVLPCGTLHRVQADTIPGNIASEKVLLKLGFSQEGIRRQCVYIRGQYLDLKCFGLLKPEFEN